jgi:hypothetical protein
VRFGAAGSSELAEVQSALRKSKRLFPAQLLFLIVAGVVAWLLLRFEAAPRFVVGLLVVVAAISFIGEAINIAWCRRAVHRLKRGS